MNQDFDVREFDTAIHRRILGLAPSKPLRNWYDVLGLTPPVADDSAVEEAIVCRLQDARRYEVGTYQEDAIRVLEELAKAFTWLTDSHERRRYDESLRAAPLATRGPPAPAKLEDEVLAWSAPRPAPPSSAAETIAETRGPDAGRGVPPLSHREPPATKPPAGAAGDAVCPKCGRPTAPTARVCYHCGFRKPSPEVAPGRRSPAAETASSSDDMRRFVRQDLTREQLIEHLREMKTLAAANRLASPYWLSPLPRVSGLFGKTTGIDVRSQCQACGRPLPLRQEAYGLRQADLVQSVAYLTAFARKLETLGRHHFRYPLDADGVARVRALLPARRADGVHLFCRHCAAQFLT